MLFAERQEEDDETDVSLITGALRSSSVANGEPAESPYGSSVVLRNQTMTVANTNSAGTHWNPSYTFLRTVYCLVFVITGILQKHKMVNLVLKNSKDEKNSKLKCFFHFLQHPFWRVGAGVVWSRSWERRLW